MFRASRNKVKTGRFNYPGVSHLYLSDEEITARKEVLNKGDYCILKTHNCNELFVLDMPSEANEIFKYCLKAKIDKSLIPKEYLLSNFISQCITYQKEESGHGIDGIRFPSTKNENGYSFVFFYKSEDSFYNSTVTSGRV